MMNTMLKIHSQVIAKLNECIKFMYNSFHLERGISMAAYTTNDLYENVTHMTDSAPYSIHFTNITPEHELALYLHWHNEMEFFLLHSGELEFHIEDNIFHLHPGEGIFIPPKLLHYAIRISDSPTSFHAFVLSPECILSTFDTRLFNTYLLPIMHNNLSYCTLISKEISWQKEILAHLEHLFTSCHSSELFIRGISLFIWDQLYQHHLSKINSNKSLLFLTDQLVEAITYIQNNYQQDISLRELAECVHLSEGQFCRSFKLLTGMTPFRYLNRFRILQSCKDLCNTNKKITDIATSNGYNNISNYNREFMKLMKMTPSNYRNSDKLHAKGTFC